MRGEQALKNLLCNVLLQVVVAVSGLVLPRFYLEVYGSTLNGMVSSVTQFMSYLSLVEAGISAATIVGLYGPLAEHNISDINGVLAATKKFYNQTGQIYIILVLLLTILYPLLINGQVDSFTVRCIVFILSSSNLIDYLFLGKIQGIIKCGPKRLYYCNNTNCRNNFKYSDICHYDKNWIFNCFCKIYSNFDIHVTICIHLWVCKEKLSIS